MKQLQRMQGHAGAKMKKAVSDEPPQAKKLMPPRMTNPVMIALIAHPRITF